MALVVESYQSNGNSNSSSIAVTKPTGLAVGDLMIAQLSIQGTGQTITLPTGFTEILYTEAVRKTQLSYKVAESADVSATDFTFSWTGGTANNTCYLTRITGNATSNPIVASAGQTNSASTTCTAPTITPNGLNLILFFTNHPTGRTVSGYSITTTDPSWTELYDGAGGSSTPYVSMAYGLRNAETATGSGTATLSGSEENHGALVAITAPPDVTVTPSVVDLTISVQAPSVSGGAVVTIANPFDLTLSIPSPTVSSPTPDWTNLDKSANSTFTNPDKS